MISSQEEGEGLGGGLIPPPLKRHLELEIKTLKMHLELEKSWNGF